MCAWVYVHIVRAEDLADRGHDVCTALLLFLSNDSGSIGALSRTDIDKVREEVGMEWNSRSILATYTTCAR